MIATSGILRTSAITTVVAPELVGPSASQLFSIFGRMSDRREGRGGTGDVTGQDSPEIDKLVSQPDAVPLAIGAGPRRGSKAFAKKKRSALGASVAALGAAPLASNLRATPARARIFFF